MMRLVKVCSLAMLSLYVASCATPVESNAIPVAYEPVFGSADTNKDGAFSLAEVNSCSSTAQLTEEQKAEGVKLTKNNFSIEEFAAADEDKNDKLSVDELIVLLGGGKELDDSPYEEGAGTGYGHGLTQCGED